MFHALENGEHLTTAQMALRVLGLFSEAEPMLGVTEIGRRLNIHKSKASRLVLALTAENFLQRVGGSRHYALAGKVFAIGSVASRRRVLLEASQAELYQVRMATGQNVHLAVLAGAEVIHLERVWAEHLMKMVLANVKPLPLHATSTGKCLLAYASKELERLVLSQPLARYTNHTITTEAALQNELSLIRSSGFALNSEEFRNGMSALSLPVFDHQSQCLGALTVVAPSDKLSGSKLEHVLKLLREATIKIRRNIRRLHEKPEAMVISG